MSSNIKQIWDSNPTTTFQATDLLYLGRSPYGTGDDFAFEYSDLIPLTAKGDLMTFSTKPVKLSVGTDHQILGALSSQGNGLQWFSLLGTTNQITITPSGSDFTFSLPQSISTADAVRFRRMGLNTAPSTNVLEAVGNTILVGNTETVQQTLHIDASSNSAGGLLVAGGTAGTAPNAEFHATALDGNGANILRVRNDTGDALVIDNNRDAQFNNISAGTWNGTTIDVANGGTGLTSVTSELVPFGNGTGALQTDADFNYNNTQKAVQSAEYRLGNAEGTQDRGLFNYGDGTGWNFHIGYVTNTDVKTNVISINDNGPALTFNTNGIDFPQDVNYTITSGNQKISYETSKFVLDLKNSRVGINQLNPAQALDVSGTILSSGGITFGTSPQTGVGIDSNGTDLTISANTGDINLRPTNGSTTNAGIYTSTGDMGVGNITPNTGGTNTRDAKLFVDGNIALRGTAGGGSWSGQNLLFGGDGTGYALNFRSVNNAGTLATNMVSVYDNAAITVGSPTGGNKGVGTINTVGDIYKNNSAYTNPDYVLEKWNTGDIVQFKDNEGAEGYELKSIEQCENIMRSTHRLPGMTDDPMGTFKRQDWLLEKMEEAFIYIIELKKEIKDLKSQLEK